MAHPPSRARSAPERLPTTRVYNPIWISRPSTTELQRRYPAGAQRAGISGSATMDCVIAPDGALRHCAVVSETPVRQGFGQAALALAASYRAGATTSAGWPTSGYRVRVPVEWRQP
jgi:protein TonB